MENNIFDSLQEAIKQAEYEAFKRGFKANTIVINEKFSFVKSFVAQKINRVVMYPPVIMGYKLLVGKLPDNDADFMMFYQNNIPSAEERIAELEKENEMLKAKLQELKEKIEE